MENEKRFIIAIGLCVLVILAWQSYMRKYAKPYQMPQQTTEVVSEVPLAVVRTTPVEVEEQRVGIKEKTAEIATDLFGVTLTTSGAAIKEMLLFDFKDNVGGNIVLSASNQTSPHILQTLDSLTAKPEPWTLSSSSDSSATFIKSGKYTTQTKNFNFHKSSYIIELEHKIINNTSLPQTVSYQLVSGAALIGDGRLDKMYAGADAQVGEKVIRKKPGARGLKQGEQITGSPAWVSARSRYFSIVLKPNQQEKGASITSPSAKDIWSAIDVGPISIEPNDTVVRSYTMYAGPNNLEALASIGPGTNNVISYGIFGGIAKILFKGLQFFYKISGNYGIAIIGLTLVISLVLSPLTRKSMHSMKETQKVQPEVERIKKEHSGDPQKMNKEIMELYKTHHINPVGGCLPMLLQIPVFFALYQLFLRSVELKGAHFLWIKDLSEPDMAFTISQKLPIIGNSINILPILAGLAMFAQQKISHPGGEVSEQQRMMAIVMPVVFTFIFYSMPSGWILYFVTNTALTLILQEFILKSRKPA